MTYRSLLETSACALAALAVAACGKSPAATTTPPAPADKNAPAAAPGAPTETAAIPDAPTNTSGIPKATAAVATVNGKDISAERFNIEFVRLVGRSTKVPADRLRRIAQNVLNRLIDQELRDQAIRNENVQLSETDFDEAWREFTARFRKPDGTFDEAALESELARTHTTIAAMKEQVRQQRLGHKLVEKLGRVDVSEADLKSYYDQNPSAWVEAPSREVRPILIRVPADATEAQRAVLSEKAEAASAALRKGEDFETVAKKYSEGPLAPIHLTRASAQPELEPVAFELRVGEVSKPVKTRWGWYILRLIEKNEERTRSYAEVREEIRNQLTTRRTFTEERRIFQELRKKAEIVEKLPF